LDWRHDLATSRPKEERCHFWFSIRLSPEGSCRVVHPSTRIQTIWPKNAGFSPMGPSGVTLLRRGGDHAAK
jgi:hypothetical protein